MTEGWFKDGLCSGECLPASAAHACVGDRDEMNRHLSMRRAPRADGAQWGWLPGRGDTELASEAEIGRRGEGGGPGGSVLGLGCTTQG